MHRFAASSGKTETLREVEVFSSRTQLLAPKLKR